MLKNRYLINVGPDTNILDEIKKGVCMYFTAPSLPGSSYVFYDGHSFMCTFIPQLPEGSTPCCITEFISDLDVMTLYNAEGSFPMIFDFPEFNVFTNASDSQIEAYEYYKKMAYHWGKKLLMDANDKKAATSFGRLIGDVEDMISELEYNTL